MSVRGCDGWKVHQLFKQTEDEQNTIQLRKSSRAPRNPVLRAKRLADYASYDTRAAAAKKVMAKKAAFIAAALAADKLKLAKSAQQKRKCTKQDTAPAAKRTRLAPSGPSGPSGPRAPRAPRDAPPVAAPLVKRHDATATQYALGDFVATLYNQEWRIGKIITKVHPVYSVDFMATAPAAVNGFSWPAAKDIGGIGYGSILMSVPQPRYIKVFKGVPTFELEAHIVDTVKRLARATLNW